MKEGDRDTQPFPDNMEAIVVFYLAMASIVLNLFS